MRHAGTSTIFFAIARPDCRPLFPAYGIGHDCGGSKGFSPDLSILFIRIRRADEAISKSLIDLLYKEWQRSRKKLVDICTLLPSKMFADSKTGSFAKDCAKAFWEFRTRSLRRTFRECFPGLEPCREKRPWLCPAPVWRCPSGYGMKHEQFPIWIFRLRGIRAETG